ncbi:SART-1 family protein DOT2 [Babesia sp. Xinjiang]|uniref:SART-1 family protein DOT2 n=1 Tax=Babesia sp. Xinjiang TaxID=462227 RepID=UPI000A2172D5|nr:SART-1 family protein DOT2 [Babesia sp. Xinjiang]ORM40128.1 SART-1 family protein DOT2 [Babesia sp. Xinjiang]
MEPSGGDAVLSCSIEETNAIRIKLGLKPLAVRDSTSDAADTTIQTQAKLSHEEDENDEANEARRRLIEGGGVADLLARGECLSPETHGTDADLGDGGYRSLDVNEWSKRMSALHGRKRLGVLNYSDDEEEDVPLPKVVPAAAKSIDAPKLKVLHKVDELPLESGKEVVLTLADVGVLEAEAAGVAEVNFLEQPDLAKRKSNKAIGQYSINAEYNPYEDEEHDDGLPAHAKRDILHKYDKAVEEYQGATLSNLAGKKHGFYLNVEENGETDVKRPSTYLTQPTEESFDFGGLKRKKNLLKNREKTVNWNKIFDPKTIASNANSTVQTDYTEEESAPSQIVKRSTLDLDDVEECNHLYNQLAKHRSRILANIKEEPVQQTVATVRTSVIDTGIPQAEADGVHIDATSELIKAVKPMHDSPIVEKSTARETERTKNITASSTSDDEFANMEFPDGGVDNNTPMTMGIAGALAYLKDKGDLIEKKRDLDDIGKDITIQYIDEYGRQMTPKEAFRQLSWKFHGKTPGLNKRERTIKRIERGEFLLVSIYS